MTRLYISGAMSRLPDNNFPAFDEAERLLREAGYDVENPATKGEIEGWTWDDYIRYDIIKLAECDGIANLPLPTPDWISEGRELENHIGRALKASMTILTVEEWLARASLQLAMA